MIDQPTLMWADGFYDALTAFHKKFIVYSESSLNALILPDKDLVSLSQ